MFDGFLDLLEDGIRWLFYWLSTMIYDLIIWIYEIFLKLCNSRILDADLIEALSKRIGLILGLVMLFMVIVSAIQMLIDPDKVTDKEKGAGNIVKKIIIVIIMLGVSNSAFRALYGIQKIVIESNILGKILVPYEVETDKFGGVLSAELFTAFYHFNPEIEPETEEECYDYSEFLKSDIIQKKGFDKGYECLNTRNSDDKYVMNFNALLSPIVGIVAIYFLFSYTITIGIRTIQLAFLEIISPMAIISHLSLKKDTMFDKWWKLYFSTYTDVFIRILIINFVVFLISLVFATEGSIVFWDSIGGKTGDFRIDAYITVIIVIALLMFAKKAPELLKNIFPSSGGSGLGFGMHKPKELFDTVKKPLGVAAGVTGVGLLSRKVIAGFDSARNGQGFMNGFKSQKSALQKWRDKQLENYMPLTYSNMKTNADGKKKVTEAENKWKNGVDMISKIIEDSKGAITLNDDQTGWKKMLDGKTRKNYGLIFKNEKFIYSKMAVDKETKIEDKMKLAYQELQTTNDQNQKNKIINDLSNETGLTITTENGFYEEYEKQQKKVSSVKEHHEFIRQAYQRDAKAEDMFKYMKGNETNPTNIKENLNDEVNKKRNKKNQTP